MSSFNENTGSHGAPSGAMQAFNLPGPPRRREVAEEQPEMRSVGMMSAAPGLSADRMGMGMFGASPKLGPPSGGFSKIGPPPKGMKPLKLGVRGPSFEVKQEWDKVVTAPVLWDVKGENLEMIPEYPLERTHREIKDTEACEVAGRIAEAVKVLSISTKFDGIKASAKCKTSDLVSFRIRLYAGGEGGQPVVVELQRRSGPASSFMRSCRAILEAAEGCITKAPPSPKKLPPFMKVPARDMKCLQSVPMESSTETDTATALESALSLFREKNLDSNLLGLENMCFLTDPLKTSPVTARIVAKRVILAEKSEIREDVGALLQTDVFPSEPDDEYDGHREQLRHHALVLFSNSLDVCSKDGSLVDAVKSQDWFATFLIPTLIHDGRSASVCANSAHLAVMGLNSIASCSDYARRLVVENGGVEALQEAHKFGVEQHELLAEEARRCLDLIES